MTTTAQSVIRRCVDTLQDAGSVRWTLRELVRYLNDGQREIVVHRPDATVTLASVALAAGSARQSIPASGTKLIDVIRNTAGSKRAIRMCARELLDAQVPGWQAQTNTANEIVHFMYDPRDPKVFYVYPPAGTASSVELLHAILPTDIAQPAEGAVITSSMTDADTTQVPGNVSVSDIYTNCLQDYVLYRAFSKDAEVGNGARAQAHYGLFANALGIEIAATVAVSPKPKGKPTVKE